MKNDKPVALLIFFFIVGSIIIMLSLVINIIHLLDTKDYEKTLATFVRADFVHTSDNGTKMYYLNYKYTVKDKTYHRKTDYTTSIIPKLGSKKEIKYNPEHPSQSYIAEFNDFIKLQLLGIFFFFISLTALCNKSISRSISIFIWSFLIIIYCIYGDLYQSLTGIIFMLIPITMNFISIYFFIENVKLITQEKLLKQIENNDPIKNL